MTLLDDDASRQGMAKSSRSRLSKSRIAGGPKSESITSLSKFDRGSPRKRTILKLYPIDRSIEPINFAKIG